MVSRVLLSIEPLSFVCRELHHMEERRSNSRRCEHTYNRIACTLATHSAVG